MSSPKAHSPCTQFFSSTIIEDKCSLLIGHDDGSVSLINFDYVEGSLKYSSRFIEQIHSETILGFVECPHYFEPSFVCWSGKELKIIDRSLKIITDLTSHVKDCDNIRGVFFENKTLLIVLESGTVVKLLLKPHEFSVSNRKEFELCKGNQFGKVKLVESAIDSIYRLRFYMVTWTDSYCTKCYSENMKVKCEMEMRMFALSRDGSLAISVIDNQTEGEDKSSIAFVDLGADNMPIVKSYPVPTEDGKDQQVLSVGFCGLRYQAFILTENRIVTRLVDGTDASYEMTSQDVEKKFPTLTNVKFKFFTCTEHVKFLLLEEAGKVIVFNSSPEDMEEIISVDKALILPLPAHKKFTTQQCKLFNMATERKLTNIEFCFIEN